MAGPRIAYLGLGSNLDDPVAQVQDAIRRLQDLPALRLLRRSSLYRNPPMGPQDQPAYVNAVGAVETEMEPDELLAAMLAIETDQGRQRDPGSRWGPRRIDIDILVYGALRVSVPGLEIPHPGISERNFVLFPLLEIAPDLEIPGLGPVRDLAAACDGSGLERI